VAKTKLTQEVIDLFWLLANPQRLRIAELIGSGIAHRTDDLSKLVGINESSISINLQMFRNGQFLVELKKEGRRVYYGLDKEKVTGAIFAFADALDLDLSQRPKAKKKKTIKKK
jgi:DNA-binding transcriptional ArsR family regulator